MQQNSWLYSDSFLKRAFAIWGHAAVAHLIIMIPFMILWFLMIGMIFSAVMNSGGMMDQVPPGMEYQQ
ncbi:MAG: hypothetical protein HOO67_07980 [Candidatus Peribacteraceae bacterium]|nr:hypothetical protein [Candidatus Peribacteraceae bacterium]